MGRAETGMGTGTEMKMKMAGLNWA
jgi:hypothetical protein